MSSSVAPRNPQSDSQSDSPAPGPRADRRGARGPRRRWWGWGHAQRCDPDDRITSRHWLGLGATIVIFVLVLWLLPTRDWIAGLIGWLNGLGHWGAVVFAVAYAVLAVLAVPVTPMNIGAGVLLGWWAGFVAAMAGATAAAVASFLLSRYAAQDWVRAKLACYPKYAALIEDLEDEGWKAVLMIRLNPLVPASFKNYCFGVTKVSLLPYTLLSVAAQLPIIAIYTYLGSAGYLTLRAEGEPLDTVDYVLYGLGVVAAVVLTALMTWYGRRKLNEIERRHPHHHDAPAG